MPDFIRVASVSELADPGKMLVEVDDRMIALFRVQGKIYAIDDVCTHDGGELAGGAVEGDVVICPRHGARFCLRTGAALTPPAYEPVRTYETRINDGIVEVKAPV